MSTKAIRALAEAARDGAPIVASMGVDALAEIALIERAATALVGDARVYTMRGGDATSVRRALDTLVSISKEAP